MAKPNYDQEEFQKLVGNIGKSLAKAFKDGLAEGLAQVMQQVIQPQVDSLMTSTLTNPYILFGLSPSATEEEFKKRYKDLMRIYHPDKGASDDTMVKLLNQAWEDIRRQKGW